MGFSVKQLKALKRSPDGRHIRTRAIHGRELTYLEGWYAISEANRIFGFDGWSRETLETRCVLARETKGSFLAIYLARVRLTVKARGATVIREGHGSGEGRGTSPGEVHDIALKAAETDATKRALATFGRPFGLELYRGGITAKITMSPPLAPSAPQPSTSQASQTQPRPLPAGHDAHSRFHPDDLTPIPRPSRYYGERTGPSMLETMRQDQQLPAPVPERGTVIVPVGMPPNGRPPDLPSLPSPAGPSPSPARIDKSLLALAEPKRLRDKAHLKFVATQACLVCGRHPCDPHHLRFAQARAIGLKVSDEFTVPLCRGHHRQLHRHGDERIWWQKQRLEPMAIALKLWQQSHLLLAPQTTGEGGKPK
jgi:hypothetical protein